MDNITETIFNQIEQELGAGMVPRIFKLLAPNPPMLANIWGQFRSCILQGALPRILKEMVGLIVARATYCDYVKIVHMHSLTLQGIDKQLLAAVSQGEYNSEQFSRLFLDTLRYTSLAVASLTSEPGDLTANPPRLEAGQVLAQSGLNPIEQLELITTIALFEQMCTLANLLNLDPNQP